ncbi:ATP-binding protein [Streptomyces sp. NPDC020681]|uniref:ATP-binding protein n=1 Tax=Streptomyces sp. NPDC020681 TaxID=3365083 RepID=UPI00378EE41B
MALGTGRRASERGSGVALSCLQGPGPAVTTVMAHAFAKHRLVLPGQAALRAAPGATEMVASCPFRHGLRTGIAAKSAISKLTTSPPGEKLVLSGNYQFGLLLSGRGDRSSPPRKPEVVMTAQAPPEPVGQAELLALDSECRVTRTDQLFRESHRNAADDPHEAHFELVSVDARDVGRLRRLAQEFLTDLKVPPAARDDALLIVSELVTNAVLHASPPAALRVRCIQRRVLRIEVTDGGPQPDPPSKADQHGEHGRGMQIVAAIAVRYGTVTHAGGATRWAELNSR